MKKYTQLTTAQREIIYLHLEGGKSLREIGKVLGRSHRTIGREIKRNGHSSPFTDKLIYSPSRAQRLVKQRREEGRLSKLESDQALRRFVIGKLNRGWSPEQIAGRLKLKGPADPPSYETIYQFVYARENKALRLWEFLRRGHKRRQIKGYRRTQSHQNLGIPGRVFIEERPQEANSREKFGHFETDDLEGLKSEKEAVSVVVDRKTGLVNLDLMKDQTAQTKALSLTSRLESFPLSLVKTMTFDNGHENAKHQEVGRALKCQTYFCHPYHSWEKGTVENTIGLVRSYLPKKTSLTTVNQTDLNVIAWELNQRPRKRLGFYNPSEVVFNETRIGSLQV